MVNLPIKGTHEKIECTLVSGFGQCDYFQIRNSNGFNITELQANDPHKLARLLTEARDAGFEQGRAYVRDALGVQ